LRKEVFNLKLAKLFLKIVGAGEKYVEIKYDEYP